MDALYELHNSLGEEEKKLFKKFLTYKSNAEGRKDSELFESLSNQTGKNKKDSNTGAHNILRMRLKLSIENFVFQNISKNDPSLYIIKHISIARFLYLRKKYDLAWKYLEQAEKTAIKAEEFKLLNQIYHCMIEYAWTQKNTLLQNLIQKEQQNKADEQVSDSLNLALSVIHQQLNEASIKGQKPNVEQIIQSVLNQFGIHDTVSKKASHRYKTAMLIKLNLEEKNDYESLYQNMIRILDDMQAANLFDKYNYQYRIELLNIICYASARAGNFALTEKYVQIIEEENKNYPETDLLSIRSFMAKSVMLGNTNRLKEGLAVLDYLRNKYQKLYSYDDYFFMMLNYNSISDNMALNDTKKARSYMNELLKQPKRIIRFWGMEALYYCHVIECILAIETNDPDYAYYRIASIERKYKDFLNQSQNERNRKFLLLLRQISKSDEVWLEASFKQEAWNFIYLQKTYMPGIEFVSFNAWLYARLQNIGYSEEGYNELIMKHEVQ